MSELIPHPCLPRIPVSETSSVDVHALLGKQKLGLVDAQLLQQAVELGLLHHATEQAK